MEYFNRMLWDGKPFYREEHSTFFIKVKEFSNTNIHTPSTDSSEAINCIVRCKNRTYRDIRMYVHDKGHSIVVYPNGYDSSTEGHVSMKFCFLPDGLSYEAVRSRITHVDFTCFIVVIDADGTSRLPQSFVFTHDGTEGRIPNFLVKNFLSRHFLLTADKFLLDDMLTIEVDVVLKEYYTGEYKYISFKDLMKNSFKIVLGTDEPTQHYLLLKSAVAERLCRESKYFERLCTIPMIESGSEYMKIHEAEFGSFLNMVITQWKLALYDRTLEFSLYQILETYATADYYGVESVLDTCRRWLKLVCRTRRDALAVSRFAQRYDDALLQIIAMKALIANEKLTEVEGGDMGKYPDEVDEEWTATPIVMDSTVYFIFTQRLKTGLKEGAGENASEISNCYL